MRRLRQVFGVFAQRQAGQLRHIDDFFGRDVVDVFIGGIGECGGKLPGLLLLVFMQIGTDARHYVVGQTLFDGAGKFGGGVAQLFVFVQHGGQIQPHGLQLRMLFEDVAVECGRFAVPSLMAVKRTLGESG